MTIISMLLHVSALNGPQIGTIMSSDREKVANYIVDRDKYIHTIINDGLGDGLEGVRIIEMLILCAWE